MENLYDLVMKRAKEMDIPVNEVRTVTELEPNDLIGLPTKINNKERETKMFENETTTETVTTNSKTPRGRGRPKGKANRPNICKKCGREGHNSRTCKPVVNQVSFDVTCSE